MKILIVSEILHLGGAETFVVRLANELCELHEVTVIVFYKNVIQPELAAQIDKRVQFKPLEISGLRLLQRMDGLFRRLGIDVSMVHNALERECLNIVTELKPDVVHTHLFKPDWVFARIKHKSAVTFHHVTTIHGDYSSYYNKEVSPNLLNIKRKIEFTLKQVNEIVCLSNEHIAFFHKNFPEVANRLSLIYNGYRPLSDNYKLITKKQLGLPETGMLYGMVSRGVEKKGWKKAIDAFVEARLENAYLILTGTGDFLDALAAANRNDHIIFTGYSANPVEMIQHFDVCLLPSLFHYESLPTVIIEYLFCGKPVIATRVGEIPLMIENSNGEVAGDILSFDNFDIDIHEFSTVMTRYYADTSYYNSKGGVASSAFSKFNMKHCINEYLKLYNNGN